MEYFYSKYTNGFYVFDDPSTYPNLPEDITEITEDVWTSLFEGQAIGKLITSDKNGKPTLVDRPGPTAEQIIANNQQERDRSLSLAAIRIAPLQYASDLEDATDEELVLLKKWKEYSVALNRLDITTKSVIWPTTPE